MKTIQIDRAVLAVNLKTPDTKNLRRRLNAAMQRVPKQMMFGSLREVIEYSWRYYLAYGPTDEEGDSVLSFLDGEVRYHIDIDKEQKIISAAEFKKQTRMLDEIVAFLSK